jgi:hypothetical protein
VRGGIVMGTDGGRMAEHASWFQILMQMAIGSWLALQNSRWMFEFGCGWAQPRMSVLRNADWARRRQLVTDGVEEWRRYGDESGLLSGQTSLLCVLSIRWFLWVMGKQLRSSSRLPCHHTLDLIFEPRDSTWSQ